MPHKSVRNVFCVKLIIKKMFLNISVQFFIDARGLFLMERKGIQVI